MIIASNLSAPKYLVSDMIASGPYSLKINGGQLLISDSHCTKHTVKVVLKPRGYKMVILKLYGRIGYKTRPSHRQFKKVLKFFKKTFKKALATAFTIFLHTKTITTWKQKTPKRSFLLANRRHLLTSFKF